MSTLDRRKFLASGAAVAGSAAVAGHLFTTLDRAGATSSPALGATAAAGYGPLVRTPDQNGDEIIAVPEGFTYVTFSKTLAPMSDGTLTPRAHDGMAAFRAPGGSSSQVLLIRNHEVRNGAGDFTAAVQAPAAAKYDPLAPGGTVSVLFDTATGQVVRDWVSIAGTHTNCAGGVAHKAAGWITCEETTLGPNQGFAKKHGYAYLVPTTATGPTTPIPITGAGRFAHEALAVDPANGVIYLTEDSGDDSGLYRYLPRDARRPERGGILQMLAIQGRPNYDTRTGQTVGTRLPARWVHIPDPDPDLENGALGVAEQGLADGAALFNRLEGIWWNNRGPGFYFVSTSGGDAHFGQVWYYDARRHFLSLFFESPGGSVLDSPDNLLVSPQGGVILCEDNAGAGGGSHPLAPEIEDVNRIVAVTRAGEPFELALNTMSEAEFAGATFSPDGKVLFANLQGGGDPGSGLTVAITGPWQNGPL